MGSVIGEPTVLGPERDKKDQDASTGVTLFFPHGRGEKPDSRTHWTLPTYLQEQISRRLWLTGLTYSAAFFSADLLPIILTGQILETFRSPTDWIASVTSILVGLAVAALAYNPRILWRDKVHLGLLFEVFGSYGIAISLYLEEPGVAAVASFPDVPSWVAIWMIMFSVAVPAPPGKALFASLASATAPGVVIGFSLQNAGVLHTYTPQSFFFDYVFQYLVCVGLSYAVSRIVFTLGRDVSRARELGSYRLIERLGRGGMGEVWKASHQLLAREAAIKFIRPASIMGISAESSRSMRRRFELEARSTASLTSAHTVDLYDFGVSDNGTFYYIMELLDGFDCDLLVRRFGALPPARAIHLMVQVCESLEEAHEKGLIHRDIKPANIYVSRNGMRFDFVKVLDFGLVVHHLPPSSSEKLTLPDQAVGTPSFMAPEVILGQTVDRRCDLYGLGGVAYWLVTGRPVFEGASPLDIISKQLRETPEPPSRRAAGAIPRDLDALILRCLEKLPERRPSSAREIAQALRSIPIEESWSDERATAWWVEHVAPVSAKATGEPEPVAT